MKGTFIDACLTGNASPSDIDEYVARWHDNEETVSLREFLGMTRDEYRTFMQDGSKTTLQRIIDAHGVTPA